VTDWLGGVSTFIYDADNRLASMTRPNGVTTTYSYDADNRLTGFSDGTLASTTLIRDANGRITTANRTVPTAATAGGMTAATHSFDAAAQVSTAGFAYDAMGRLTSNGATTYTWDLASRLIGAGTATHTYDGMGYRLSRTTAAGTRNYVWNHALGLSSVAIEKQGAADLRYYVYTPGGALLYSIDAAGNARHFYHFDEAGNTRFVSNDAGAVEASYAYSPFGVLLASTGALDNPFTWQGQMGVMDDGNGLYYIRARYYDAGSGRFLSRDAVRSTHPLKINPYQYALNNPIKYADINGNNPNPAPHAGFSGSTMDQAVSSTLQVNTDLSYVIEKGASFVKKQLQAGLDAVESGKGYDNFNKAFKDKFAKAWRAKISKATKISKVAETVGNVGTIIGAGVEAYKTAEALNLAHERGQQANKNALTLQSRQLEAVKALLKAKKLTFDQAARMIKEINARFDEERERAVYVEWIDTGLAAARGFKNTLIGLIPAPVQHVFGLFE
jgi:RHS repeat-associated protein